MVQRHKLVAANATGCSFDSHSRKNLSLIFCFPRFSVEYVGKWEMECIITRFPLPCSYPTVDGIPHEAKNNISLVFFSYISC